MKKYGIFHPLVLSFFSKDLYIDVAANWKGSGFLYLLLLAFICSFPNTLRLSKALKNIPAELEPIIIQFPDIKITDGNVSIDKPEPYIINDPSQDNKPAIIIDTTGKYTSLEGTPAQVLITKTQLIAKNRNSTRVYDLTSIKNFVLTKDIIRKFLKAFFGWFPVVAFPFIIGFLFVYRILNVLIFSVCGLIMAALLKTKMSFEQLMRLSAMAITPAIIAGILLSFADFKIPFLLRVFVGLGYLFFAIKINKQDLMVPVVPSGKTTE